MARVTVEDCVEKVPNRFDLVLLAAQRARDLTAGAPMTVADDQDKNPVVALREIAAGTVPLDQIENAIIRGLQKQVDVDEPEQDEVMELMRADTEVIGARRETEESEDEADTEAEEAPEPAGAATEEE